MMHIQELTALIAQIEDPEIPVLTIADLGILRSVTLGEDGLPEITITPTYSGCPAMQTIEIQIRATLQDVGIEKFHLKTVLSPAWTTDWLTEAGRSKLLAYGIAPPVGNASKRSLLHDHPVVLCPQCSSEHTTAISDFGSTSCKALWKCLDCLEPFDYFKCH